MLVMRLTAGALSSGESRSGKQPHDKVMQESGKIKGNSAMPGSLNMMKFC